MATRDIYIDILTSMWSFFSNKLWMIKNEYMKLFLTLCQVHFFYFTFSIILVIFCKNWTRSTPLIPLIWCGYEDFCFILKNNFSLSGFYYGSDCCTTLNKNWLEMRLTKSSKIFLIRKFLLINDNVPKIHNLAHNHDLYFPIELLDDFQMIIQ